MPRPSSILRGAILAPLFTGLLLLFAQPTQAISHRTLMAPSGAAAEDQFGCSVAPAGDFNGDGYADIIVGASLNDAGATNAGRAYVYYGGPGADDVADLTLTGAAAGDCLGWSVAGAGDVNGDGFADVIVGSPFNDGGGTDAGRAYVYYGGSSPDATADLILTGAAASDCFGESVAGAGDVNGDGYADVIVGAYLNDAGGAGAGRAYVYYGGAVANNVADLTLTGAAAGDQFGYAVATAGDVNGDGFADVIVGAPFNDAGGSSAGQAYVYHGGPGADTVVDLTLTGAAADDRFGSSVTTAGDVNGDGHDDVLVGATYNDTAGTNAGQACIYHGGPAADAVADLVLTGAAGGDLFGWSAAPAGDVNGDGSADIIVATYLNDAGGDEAGRAYVYFGGPEVDDTADLTLTGPLAGDHFGYSVAGAGDVDGDGRAEIIVGAPASGNKGQAWICSAYPYQVISPNGGEQWVCGQSATVRWRGHDVADLDLSTDGGLTWTTVAARLGGLAENTFALPVPFTPTDCARVRLTYAGQAPDRSTADASDNVFRIALPVVPSPVTQRLERAFTGAAAGDNLGASVAGAGDVNGDDHADVIVGARSNDAGGADAGRAYVHLGGPAADAAADLVLTGAAAGDFFGQSAASAGDVNGDGYNDVIVGAPYNDAVAADAGRAYVYYGGSAPNNVADITLSGAAAGDYFGTSVASAGDFNGDGCADVIVGAPYNNGRGADAGRVYIYYGGYAANNVADIILTGAYMYDLFGTSVADAGDVNGDGYGDVIIGAQGNDAGGGEAGRAYVYYGGATIDTLADLTLTGAASGDRFGYSVAGAGDVNGDGYADVVVGAYYNDAGGSNAGRAYVYYGGPDADEEADLTLTGEAAGDYFGLSVAGAGDVNGDGFADVVVGAERNDVRGTDSGRVYLYHGGLVADEAPDVTWTAAATTDYFGASVGGAGDADGDGFDDVIVGATGNDAGGAGAGRAYLYNFNRYFLTAPNGGETWNVGAARSIQWQGAEPADLWLSADGGRTWDLLESGAGGTEGNAFVLRVPHSPSRFSRVRVTPADAAVRGTDQSDSLFTIQTSVSLLSLKAEPGPGGTVVSWSTDPGVGPEGLAGYRLYRVPAGSEGNGSRIGPELIVETSYTDGDGAIAGSGYRLCAINGLQEELELGRIAPAAAFTGMRVWPSPARAGSPIRVTISAAGLAAVTDLGRNLEVALYDLQGRRVATLPAEAAEAEAGQVTLTWDGRTAAGSPAASGIYFVVARGAASGIRFEAEQRLVIVK